MLCFVAKNVQISGESQSKKVSTVTVINFWCSYCEMAVEGDRVKRWFCSEACYEKSGGVLG